MPSGKLASVDISAGVNTLLYTAPGGRALNVTVRICNRNSSDVAIRLALLDGELPSMGDKDFLEYDTILRSNGILERSEISMAQLQSLIGYSDTSNVSFQVGGD